MRQTRRRFCFPTKTFQVRFARARAAANYFQRNDAIETLLARAKNDPLTAAANFA